MIERSATVSSVENSIAFMIVRRDPDAGKNRFFAGFYNEADHILTKDERMCWGQEKWIDLPNYAQKFNTFAEAKDWLNAIDKERRGLCSIILYGYGVFRLSNGSDWYPLKVFMSPQDSVA